MVKKASKTKKTSKKFTPISTFEKIEGFDKPFAPAIRVRAVRTNRKVNIVLGNLLLFIILFVFSSVIYLASIQGFYKNLFFLLSLIFGGLSLTFLIILLILVFLRVLKE